jgi:hypothetical protein
MAPTRIFPVSGPAKRQRGDFLGRLAGRSGTAEIISTNNRVHEIAMGLQQAKSESLPFVTAELNNLAPTAEKPRTCAFDPPPGESKSTALPEPHSVPIFDARPIADGITLDREGFALVRHPTAVRDFYDDKEVRNVYYPAAEAFLKATLKADRVFIFDHTVRRRVEGGVDVRGEGPRQPATRVHVDQTAVSGANRVCEHLPDAADELLKGRVQVINLWRPIRGPLRDAPLAMLDGETVAPGDLVASDLPELARRDLFGEIQSRPSLVLRFRDESRRGVAAEMLRFRSRRPHPVRAAHCLHRSDQAGRCAAAREHRAADAGVPQELSEIDVIVSSRMAGETRPVMAFPRH